ncbi:hypothetical protein [Humidisolicoccus flavus]|uniref:hypothetical protein n=1 Tax=Humidisolicoccus flavus TaxID=3111414 RepID=UPI0032512B4F
MQFYAVGAWRRTWQITADLVAAFTLIVTVAAAIAIGQMIRGLSAWSAQVAAFGTDFSGSIADAGEQLAGVPLVGEAIAAPFRGMSDAARSLVREAQAQQASIDRLALTIELVLPLVVVLLLIMVWVLPRVRFVRTARELSSIATTPLGASVLASRAIVSAPLADILALGDDVHERWRAGDAATERELAALELRSRGVRAPIAQSSVE